MPNTDQDGVDPIGIRSTDFSVLVSGAGVVDLSSGMGQIVPPGTNQSGLINSILAAGRAVVLAIGEHHLGTPGGAPDPITVPDDGVIMGFGPRSALVPDWSRLAASADDPTNDVIRIVGAKNLAKLNTTVSTSIVADTKTAVLAALGTLAPGDWFSVEGPNTTDENGVSPNPNLSFSEMMRVDAAWAGANPVALETPALQFHSSAAPATTAQAVTPVQDVFLDNFAIRAPIANNIGVGIRLNYCLNVWMSRIWGRGFSRGIYEAALGARNWTAFRITNEGDCNAIANHLSTMQFQESGIRCLGYNGRTHPNGVPRAAMNYRERCVSGTLEDCQIVHMCAGVRSWGGRRLDLKWQSTDTDAAEIIARDPTVPCTGALDTGACNVAALGEFQHACSFQARIANWTSDSNTYPPALTFGVWGNDTQNSKFDIVLENWAKSPNVAYSGITYPMVGMLLDDAWDNQLANLRVTGCNYGLITEGQCRSTIDEFMYTQVNAGGIGSIGVFLNNSGVFSSPNFGNVALVSAATSFWFGANFVASPDYHLRIDVLKYLDTTPIAGAPGGMRFTDVIMVNNATGLGMNATEVVELDPASAVGVTNVLKSTVPSQYGAVIVTGGPFNVATGFMLACPLPAAEAWISVNGAVALGDLLETAVGGSAVVNNAVAAHQCVGRALQAKAAGVGVVRIGLTA